jgi:hypothetical protein
MTSNHDPETEIRRRVYNRTNDVQLTYEEYCLLRIKHIDDGEAEESIKNAELGYSTAKKGKVKMKKKWSRK